MRRIRYVVAMSLDGHIAGPKGEADWITMDPDIDFGDLFNQFDTFLMGRRTYEATASMGGGESSPGTKTIVFSKTLRPEEHPKVTIARDAAGAGLAELKQSEGKDIWLFGGGMLFRSLVQAKLVDTVEVAIMPVMLGGGIPLLPGPSGEVKLALRDHKLYKTGIVSLTYDVVQ